MSLRSFVPPAFAAKARQLHSVKRHSDHEHGGYRIDSLILTKLSIEQGHVLGDLRISACHRLLYGGAEFAPIHVTLAHKM
jgi:hypothetical protein